MISRVFAVTIAAFVLPLMIAQPAHATKRHHRHAAVATAYSTAPNRQGEYLPIGQASAASTRTVRTRVASSDEGVIGGRPAGCPHAYCGCGVANKVFGSGVRFVKYNGKKLNLWWAPDWFNFPRATPGAGMVAVRYGHVRLILTANGDGTAVFYDPNSGGGLTRIHTDSLRGYTVVNPNVAQVAGL